MHQKHIFSSVFDAYGPDLYRNTKYPSWDCFPTSQCINPHWKKKNNQWGINIFVEKDNIAQILSQNLVGGSIYRDMLFHALVITGLESNSLCCVPDKMSLWETTQCIVCTMYIYIAYFIRKHEALTCHLSEMWAAFLFIQFYTMNLSK